ncbi:MAG TPA: metalloregulator ArsR/SmtB family transcription factor [Polyangiaceae bacterium]|nr:metalloregulator ArsR/SmtB family transcription factor [Polyangiaceae bacterium]
MSRSDAISPAQVRDAAPLFAALGDETRLRLLARLSAGAPLSITRLSTRSLVTRQAVTKHLEVLSEAGLVQSSKQGRERLWQLEPKRLEEAHAHLDRISRQWDEALDRLKAFVER